jgi:glycine/D-amino acid oxidase-like deaminating enzyme
MLVGMGSVTVIGAGIVGASIAHHLARHPDTNVTLVDAALPAGGTGGIGMAWLNASTKRPRDYFELNHAGVREYHRLAGEGHGWVHLTGSLTGDSYTSDLAGRMTELAGWGYRVEKLTGADMPPELVVQYPDELFARYPDEGWVDVPAAVSWLLGESDCALRLGCPVTALEATGSGFAVTLADGTRFPTDQLVNAAGPGADRVAALLGRELPLAPTRGLTVRLRAPNLRLDQVVHTGTISVRPDGPGLFRVHSAAVDRLVEAGADRVALVADLVGRAVSAVPGLVPGRVVAEYCGVRPIPGDGFSCVGRVAAIPGYLEAVTHSGVTLGPLLGRLVADMVRSDVVDPLLTARFSPDRFPAA